MRGQIILSHGSDSSPDATKVSALAALAESLGWRTQRPDYRNDDARGHAGSVAPRIARLRATIEALDAPPLLVGSSMGAFVSGLVSLDVPVAGLLLLATPSGIPGYARKFDLRRGRADAAGPRLARRRSARWRACTRSPPGAGCRCWCWTTTIGWAPAWT